MKKIIALGLLFASSSVLAGYQCKGTVENVYVHSNGYVVANISYRKDNMYICNITNDWKGVNRDSCKLMFSTLLTAQSTGKRVATYYNQYTCETLPLWSNTPKSSYVAIVND